MLCSAVFLWRGSSILENLQKKRRWLLYGVTGALAVITGVKGWEGLKRGGGRICVE